MRPAVITLRTYLHLWPVDEDRTRFVMDATLLQLDGESRSTRASNGYWTGPSGLRRADASPVLLLGQMGSAKRLSPFPSFGYTHVVGDLEQRGVGLRSLTESIDTSTPGGKLIFHVFGALAEFERDLIRERTHAGLAAARARGRVGGRPTVWTAEKLKTARAMYASGEHDVATIARVLGVSRASVYRGLASSMATEVTASSGRS